MAKRRVVDVALPSGRWSSTWICHRAGGGTVKTIASFLVYLSINEGPNTVGDPQSGHKRDKLPYELCKVADRCVL